MEKGLSSARPVAAIDAAGRTGVGTAASGGGLLSTWPARGLALLLVGLIAAGAIVVQRASAAPPKVDLRTAQVTRGTVTQIVAVSGSVNAANTWRLNFKTAGRLAQILVSVGQQVIVGQALATLDTSDLVIAVKQQQASLASAQAKYDQTLAGATPEDIAIAKQSVDSAKKTLDETVKSTANDVAASQQAFTKLKTNYGTAENSFGTSTSQVRTDLATFQAGFDTLRNMTAITIADLTNKLTTDSNNARTSITQADSALYNGVAYSNNQLTAAANDFFTARDNVVAAVAGFDSQVARGLDTSAASAAYQAAQLTYAAASSKFSTALDSTSATITTASSSAATAQNTLTTATAKSDGTLDQARTDLVSLQSLLTTYSQTASAIKNSLSQATSAALILTDAVTGSYVSAQQALAAAKEKSTQSQQSAQNSVDSAALSYAKTTTSPKSYDIASAYAGLLTAQTNVDNASNNLSYATLISPGAGVAAAINAQIGEMVTGGGTNNAFITVANIAQLAVHGTVGEADVAKLKIGQVATVTVDAVGSSARMTGKVTALDPVATIQQGVPVYGVDVTVDVPNPQVRPGMSGTANVIIASRQDVLVVPNLAVRSQGNRRFVQVLKDGQPVDADVVFGISNDTAIEVTSGLQEGDTVVLPQPRAAASGQPRPGGFPGGGGQPGIIGR